MDRYPEIAVVTGAGSGIGAAVARKLLDAGWRVALAGRHESTLTAVAADHPDAVCVPTDITDEDSVAALFSAVHERFGALGLLFNNAGTFGTASSIDEIDAEQWRATVEVNLTGTMLCAKHAFALMRTQQPSGGRIINNGSISAQAPRPHSVAYTATKHAVTGLTKSIDLDGREFGVQAGQIDIGNASTSMMSGIADGTGARQPDGEYRVEPVFDVDNAADAVLFMATLPASATIHELTVTATGMPFRARG